MTKEDAIHAAAEAVIEHVTPEPSSDPHTAVRLMDQAINLGATHEDIAAEILRIQLEAGQ
ncbi:hypothetical protein [Kitasatospora sp. NPDC001175]|uniref:hypothetical protein n=1 Tax=Kitasatospora sp. NPDC001175 TaxID=3157103 RepID=UPI003CFBEBC5